LKSLTTLVPTCDAARTFGSLVEPMITRIFLNCNESRNLGLLHDLLLPRLLSGEIRVADAEQALEAVV
jgi:type I restriction enzyme S subunit